jgi:hypothetical protein
MPKLLAAGSIGVVVVVVLVLVLVKVTGGSTGKKLSAPKVVPAQASVLDAVYGVSQTEASEVGVPSSVSPPHYDMGQPPLVVSGGKPVVLFIGGEFCPFCAAERWAIIMALSRFGSFADLHETTSSPWDSDPATATFTFYKSSYTSAYLDLQAVEYESNDTDGLGTRSLLMPLTTEQSNLWATYEAQYGEEEAFPFLDIGNKVLVVTPSYDPAVLAGLDQSQIAARLSNPDDPVTQSIVGTANYITAGVCSVLGKAQSPWCSNAGVKAAAGAMGLPLPSDG